MRRLLLIAAAVMLGVLLCPVTSRAPLVYRPGEGWTYESVGGAKWQRANARDQYTVAKEAFDKKQIGLAKKAARRVVKRWPLSDSAPAAQYLLGRCYEVRRWDERAFKEYQKAVEKYPKIENYDEIIKRQFAIANRFLGGQWFKLLGVIPFFPSMEKTVDMYNKIIRNGPYSEVAPLAQMNIGAAREKQHDYLLAVKAYEKAADTYHDNKAIAADALYKAGLAYKKQAETAEYDQSAASQAIGTFTDFITLYPDDPRVAEAQKIIASLRTEQARGAMQIARFYEKKRKWDGAMVYYNEAIAKDPTSSYAAQARERLDAIKRRFPSRQQALETTKPIAPSAPLSVPEKP
ncbi:MAG: outer membrane protein assembly factor BamD [Verrucomicrobia bacterium]|nr:outer membrane protein assembly factor BamD [Verrucomicrobiota bacterium]